MAFPTIPTVAAGRALTATQADTTATRTFPDLSGLTKNAGDLLVGLVIAYQSTVIDKAFTAWTGGFTECLNSGSASTMAIGACYKVSTGAETGTFSVQQAATITGHAGLILLSIAGGLAAPEGGSRADGTAAAADPGTFDPPSFGTEDMLWLAVRGSGETGTGGLFTGLGAPPTNYSDSVQTGISADAIGGVEGGVSFRQLNAASEDVGPGTCDLSNARNAALVIAVRPFGEPPVLHYVVA